MALIILLILTEDDAFNRSIHEVVGKHTQVIHTPVRFQELPQKTSITCTCWDYSTCFLIPLSILVSGIEERLMVHREVIDGYLSWQFAHPGGYPHHPV